ncbi:phosphotransferase family protein [Streptomyces achromogenes]|uniref:phosphotransferase family protein n=1 Tax=Streptomyces achromogenes TaxID=67255 RepID=UPI003701B809
MTDDGSLPFDAGTSAWLLREALPGDRPLHAEVLRGGHNNESLLLTTGRGHRYVLRRYLPGAPGVPRNPCAVEAALLRRLRGRVPVPEVVAEDPDGRATGRPALVYRFVDGTPLADVLASAPPDVTGLGRAVGSALARIGGIALPGSGHFTDGTLSPGRRGDGYLGDLPGFVSRCLASVPDPDESAATDTFGRGTARPGADGTGRAGARLGADEVRALSRLAARYAALCAAAGRERRLVHNDFNPKNVLVARHGDGTWRVTAVLDWELAFSGPPLTDVGNMLRFAHEYPSGFAASFVAGFRDGSGPLPDDWRRLSRALDLFALADILTHPPDDGLFTRARSVLARYAAEE